MLSANAVQTSLSIVRISHQTPNAAELILLNIAAKRPASSHIMLHKHHERPTGRSQCCKALSHSQQLLLLTIVAPVTWEEFCASEYVIRCQHIPGGGGLGADAEATAGAGFAAALALLSALKSVRGMPPGFQEGPAM